MTGIRELFASFSEPDEFTQHVQLDLFAWVWARDQREYWRVRKQRQRGGSVQVHRCSQCGEEGHRGMWRGRVICTNAEERAA